MTGSLAGKAAFVTGAAKGIGAVDTEGHGPTSLQLPCFSPPMRRVG